MAMRTSCPTIVTERSHAINDDNSVTVLCTHPCLSLIESLKMAEGPTTDQNSTQQNFAAHTNTDQSSSDQEADQCTTQIEGEPENTDQLSTQLDQDHKKQTEEIPGSKDKDNNRLQNDEPSKVK